MRLLVALALLSGCDVVFGLKETVDAMPAPDGPQADAAMGCWSVLYQDHDEDGDGRMDGCDNCPAIVNPDQADSDTDGVGNLCDRSPGRDRIAYFRGFASSSDVDGMEIEGGAWSVLGDALVQTMPVGEASIAIPGHYVGARVYAQLRNLSEPTMEVPIRQAGLAVSHNPVMMTGLGCGARHQLTAGSLGFLTRLGSGAPEVALLVLPSVVDIELAAVGQNGTPTCRVSGTPPAMLVLDEVGPTEGLVGFGTADSTAEFLSITVIAPE